MCQKISKVIFFGKYLLATGLAVCAVSIFIFIASESVIIKNQRWQCKNYKCNVHFNIENTLPEQIMVEISIDISSHNRSHDSGYLQIGKLEKKYVLRPNEIKKIYEDIGTMPGHFPTSVQVVVKNITYE